MQPLLFFGLGFPVYEALVIAVLKIPLGTPLLSKPCFLAEHTCLPGPGSPSPAGLESAPGGLRAFWALVRHFCLFCSC